MGGIVQLFCFPFAGGNVYSFRPFQQVFSPSVQVVPMELPGRGRRGREPLLVSFTAMVDDLNRQVGLAQRGPYALFGHSLGACLALGVAQRRRSVAPALWLFVSGRKSPKVASKGPPKHRLPKNLFLNVLKDYGGFPQQLLADEGFVDYIEPVLRADFQAIETHVAQHYPPLDIPLTVMMGSEEEFSVEEARGWCEETTGPAELVQYPGGHFFLFERLHDVVSRIEKTLGCNY